MNKIFLASSLVAIATIIAAPVHALSNTWSFTTDINSTGGAGQIISGTVDGLVEGNNSGSWITATVTNSPGSQLLGNYSFVFTNVGGPAFTVSGGTVTFADALFIRSGANELYLGGFGGYFPQLIDSEGGNPDFLNSSGQTSFAPITPVPFEFSPALGLGVLGGLVAAKKLSGKFFKK